MGLLQHLLTPDCYYKVDSKSHVADCNIEPAGAKPCICQWLVAFPLAHWCTNSTHT